MIREPNARKAWAELLKLVQQTGALCQDQDGRACVELPNALITIEDAADALELVREMQREPSWIYPAPEELRSIVFERRKGAHEYAYGPRLFGEPNQVDGFIIPLLRAHPQSRRAVATLYEPRHDSTLENRNMPVILSVQVRVRDGLELTCCIRSSDVFIGFPANVYQLRCLQEYIAKELGIATGPLHLFLISAHLFTEYEDLYTEKAKPAHAER